MAKKQNEKPQSETNETVLEPGGVYPVTLDDSANKTKFWARHLCLRDQLHVMRAADIWLDDSETTPVAYKATIEALTVALVNWENARHLRTGEPVPFAIEHIDLVCDLYDVSQLLFAIIRNGRPKAQQKKG